MPSITVDTTDGYTDQATLRFNATDRVTLVVSNNPVFAQFALENPPGLKPEAYTFDPDERRMLLAAWVWDPADFNGRRIVGCRVRSAVTGQSANVTIHA